MSRISTLQQLSVKINPDKSADGLRDLQQQLAHLQQGALERARVEGNLQAQIQGLEKSVRHFQSRPAPAAPVVPPVTIHIPPAPVQPIPQRSTVPVCM